MAILSSFYLLLDFLVPQQGALDKLLLFDSTKAPHGLSLIPIAPFAVLAPVMTTGSLPARSLTLLTQGLLSLLLPVLEFFSLLVLPHYFRIILVPVMPVIASDGLPLVVPHSHLVQADEVLFLPAQSARHELPLVKVTGPVVVVSHAPQPLYLLL